MSYPHHIDIARFVALQSYDSQTGVIREVEYHVSPFLDGWLVVFRGTEMSRFITGKGFVDVGRDLLFFPWRDRRCGWGHFGFIRGAAGVVDSDLIWLFDKSEPLYFSGHSMGASCSLAAAIMMQADGYSVREWVGFGSPRVLIGEREFAFDATNYGYAGDPVLGLPFRFRFFLRYRHSPAVSYLPEVPEADKNPHDVCNYYRAVSLLHGVDVGHLRC